MDTLVTLSNSTDSRIRLERVEVGHAESLTVAVQTSLPQLSPFMPWAVADYGRDHSLEFVNGPLSDNAFALIDVKSGTVGGVIGMNNVNNLNRLAELGYWVRSDLTGRGLATAAAQLVANYAFDTLGLHRLEIIMSVENLASRAVAERLGARREGMLRGRLYLEGQAHDAYLYSLLASDDVAWRT